MSYRTISFIILLLLFTLTTPLTIFYAQGWRFDFRDFRPLQTGGLFVLVWPKKADVLIDERYQASTSLLFGTTFIQNLLPREHDVRIEKDGFVPWTKKLTVVPKQTTEIEGVILFPAQYNPEIIVEDVSLFSFSFPQFIYAMKIDQTNQEVTFFEFEAQNPKSYSKYNFKNLSSSIFKDFLSSQEIEEAKNKQILMHGTSFHPKNPQWYVVDVEKMTITRLFENSKISTVEVRLHPSHPNMFIVQQGPKLDFLDINGVRQKRIDKDILASFILDTNLFFIEKESLRLFQLNLADESSAPIQLTAYPLPSGGQKNLEQNRRELIISSQKKIFLLWGNTFYRFDPNEKIFLPIKDGVKKIVGSPDREKFFLFNERELSLYDPNNRKEERRVQTMRFSHPIDSVQFLGPKDSYALIRSGDSWEIIELSFDGQENRLVLPWKSDYGILEKNSGHFYFLHEENLKDVKLY